MHKTPKAFQKTRKVTKSVPVIAILLILCPKSISIYSFREPSPLSLLGCESHVKLQRIKSCAVSRDFVQSGRFFVPDVVTR